MGQALDIGSAVARLAGDTVALESGRGRELRYGGLVVRDALGVVVPARLEVQESARIEIAIDDRTAAYPLLVDPIITGTPDAVLEANQAFASLGYSVAGAGDVNGEGYADVIVGARSYDAGETDEGAAFVFLGGPTGIQSGNPTTASATLQANQASAWLGYSVAGAGDVNGDGYADVIVGSPAYDSGETDEGAAFWFLGSATGIAGGNPATAAAQGRRDPPGAEVARVAFSPSHGPAAPAPRYHIALLRGCDVDQPRNLAKSVTVE